MKIPFHKPYSTENELVYVTDAIKRGEISGDNYYTNIVKSYMSCMLDNESVFMTTSGTHALEMASILIDLKDGDEVIMPSFTFPSTANAVMLRGAKPVFVEVYEDTLNLNIEDLQKKVSDKTKAIIPVHYAGVSCKMEEIMDIAKANNLFVLEDAAQGFNAKYNNQYLGTIGHFGCFSFHGTKNYSSGEGGALIINEVNEEIRQRADLILHKGTNRVKFNKGEVSKYTWVDIGSSYIPSDILMAYLYGQLKNLDEITQKRRYIYEYYSSALKDYDNKGIVKISKVPSYCESNYHIFYIIFNSKHEKNLAYKQLTEKGINVTTHFVPLHSSPMGQSLGYKDLDLSATQSISERMLRLPMFTDISDLELEYIVSNLNIVLKNIREL